VSTPDPWLDLRRLTAARIALGRSGVSLPTTEWLRFAQAHALARDAVHTALDTAALCQALAAEGWAVQQVHSAAPDRATYLRRPDLGRRLAPADAARLAALGTAQAQAPAPPLVVVLADGLSAAAVAAHGLPLLRALQPRLAAQQQAPTQVVVAEQARVALGDEVGGLLRAQAVLVLVGERPGLSSPDSLGAYLTWAPRVGRQDAERNCVSNIRPEGLGLNEAAHKIAWLLGAARKLLATGVALKDESDAPALHGAPQAAGLPSAAG
jgi:ethanolamine ammonia-lyase small subunit